MKKDKNCGKKICRIGGQALIEGVMMQGASSIAMSVRAPDGKIVTEAKRRKGPGVWGKIPVIRGMISFVSSLITGTKCIMKSSAQACPEEETPSTGATVFATLLGVVIAVALFMLLPGWISDIIAQYTAINILVRSLIEGVLRITLFILYLLLVSRMKDIRRTFMYHGAEHRTINCYEHGFDVTVGNAQKCSTRHNRCGTTFLFFVMIMSILVFSLVAWIMQQILGFLPDKWTLMGVRLLCLPLIAGLSYELLRFLALLPDNKFTDIFRAPGLGLQRLTTYPPENDMAQVAITAFEAVLKMDADPTYPERDFGEYVLCEVRDEFTAEFRSAGIDAADAEWIICAAANVKRSQLGEKRIIEKQTYASICEMAEKRLAGQPLDYILGKSEFYGLTLEVNSDVLIPRPETELLCEQAVAFLGGKPGADVLDLCCGSGCIAAVIAEKTQARTVASDISEKALAVARKNAGRRGAEIVASDMFASLGNRKFDLIVSNPPYIASGEIPSLQPEVGHEPVIALDGGEDGLKFYRIIASEAPSRINEGGALMLEIGWNQAESVSKMLKSTGAFGKIEVIQDLEGHDRIVKAFKI